MGNNVEITLSLLKSLVVLLEYSYSSLFDLSISVDFCHALSRL